LILEAVREYINNDDDDDDDGGGKLSHFAACAVAEEPTRF
jgi:hypothetical protein